MINFPSSPEQNEIYENADGRWEYVDTSWRFQPKVFREGTYTTIPQYSNLSNLSTAFELPANAQLFSYGQSLSKGVSPGYTAEITPYQPYDTTTFFRGPHSVSWRSTNGYSDLIPLKEEYLYIPSEAGTYVETPCSGICNSFHELLMSNPYTGTYPRFHISCPGIGGADIDEFTKPGANRYPLLLAEITAYKNLVANDSQHKVAAVSWMQGENDYLSGGTQVDYYNTFVQMVTDFSADSKAITGQTEDPHWFSYQLSTHNYYSRDPFVALALLQASSAQNIHLVAPMYIFPYADALHLTPEGYYWYGMYVAKAMHAVFAQGKKWKPLQPTSMSKVSSTAVITYNVPYGSVQLDSLSRDVTVADYGFVFTDGSGALTINSITPQNGNQLSFTFNRAISGTLRCKYGWDVDGGNVRDSDYTFFYMNGKRYNLYNWSVIFDISV